MIVKSSKSCKVVTTMFARRSTNKLEGISD